MLSFRNMNALCQVQFAKLREIVISLDKIPSNQSTYILVRDSRATFKASLELFEGNFDKDYKPRTARHGFRTCELFALR